MLAAASLPELVRRITRPERFDPKLMSAVILTYHSFTTGQELLQLLIARFEEEFAKSNGAAPKHDAGFQVRVRVLNAIKRWLVDNALDFGDPALLGQLRAFLQRHDSHPNVKQLQTMATHVEECRPYTLCNIFTLQGGRRALDEIIAEHDADTGGELAATIPLDLCSFEPRDTGEQLTLWHWRLYSRLVPQDLVGKTAAKSSNKKMLARHAECVTFWAIASILHVVQRVKRARRIKFMVRVANVLLELGNFDLFYAVYLGIANSSVLRMKQTWKLFRDKHRRSASLFDQHEQLCKDMHFGRLRALVRDRHLQGKPCIPPMPMLLNEFERRANAYNDTMDKDGVKLINMAKRMNLAQALEQIKAYQRLAYQLPAKEIIQVSM